MVIFIIEDIAIFEMYNVIHCADDIIWVHGWVGCRCDEMLNGCMKTFYSQL